MATEERVEYDYQALGVEQRKKMVESAIFQLEKLLFENELNQTINGPDSVITHEDGSHQTLAGQHDQLEHQIQLIRDRHQGLLG